MNQILVTDLRTKHKFYNKYFFKFQFGISVTIVFITLTLLIIYFISIQQKEKMSAVVVDNYNIYKLYNNSNHSTPSNNKNVIFGIIEIPKINIYYPIFSQLNEDLLKISPCKFYGNELNKNDNICIAGHNYNNSLFFSNLFLLNCNDEIYIYDSFGNKYIYNVFNIYEVKDNDLSPIFNYNENSKELTLVTCNNFNSNRIIVKAKQRSVSK